MSLSQIAASAPLPNWSPPDGRFSSDVGALGQSSSEKSFPAGFVDSGDTFSAALRKLLLPHPSTSAQGGNGHRPGCERAATPTAHHIRCTALQWAHARSCTKRLAPSCDPRLLQNLSRLGFSLSEDCLFLLPGPGKGRRAARLIVERSAPRDAEEMSASLKCHSTRELRNTPS